MNATMVTNGKPRKQLSDQLDRLDEQLARQDSILDALAEGLNQAVADAARTGVKEAVQAAVVEMLTSAELRAALHEATAPAVERVNFWQRLKARGRQVVNKVKQCAATVRRVVAEKTAEAKSAVNTAAAPMWLAWQMRKIALIGLGIGLTVALVSYAATHGVAAAISGIGAATTAVAVQTGLWVRKTVRRLGAV